MSIKELLLEIKKIPIAMINFDNKIIDNERNIDYNMKFLKHKLESLQSIYNIFVSQQVQNYINPTKIRLICGDLEYIINYINEIISYMLDASNALATDVKAALFYDVVLDNGVKITKENYKERCEDTLNLMKHYMVNNHEIFKNMYITKMDISDVIYQEHKMNK